MVSLDTEGLTTTHWVAVAAAAVSGAIHLFLGVSGAVNPKIGPGLAASFVAAGLGFFGAIGLVLVDYRRRLVYLVGVPFTAVQIPLWYVLNFDSVSAALQAGPIDLTDKAAQVVLIVLLIVLLRRE